VPTKNIGHLADGASFKVGTFNRNCSGLIGWNYEMPNAPYLKRCPQLKTNSSNKIKLNE
jgi:hypothetical protein